MSVLSGIEGDIVTRLRTITYLAAGTTGTARGVADIRTALDLSTVPPPAAIVEYAGEEPAPKEQNPVHIGSGRAYMRTQWDVFVIAQNFGARYDDSQSGRADDSDTSEKGVMTLVDDIFSKMAGFQLPSQMTKTFWGGAKRYSIQDGCLIYVCRLYADVLRTN